MSAQEALIARAKDLFWSYDGPETFPGPDGRTDCFDVYHAVDAVELDEGTIMALVLEEPGYWGDWHALKQLKIWDEVPTYVRSGLLLGRPVNWSLPPEKRQELMKTILDPEGELISEIREALTDSLFKDEAVEAEDKRRSALADRDD